MRCRITTRALVAMVLLVFAFGSATVLGEVTEIRWATSAVGSSGHRALTHLATMLNRELPDYHITVLPTPGAVFSVKGFANYEYEGCYGADIAFYELYHDIDRFKGFQDVMQRWPVQSFWVFTMETGLMINARDVGVITEWRDLTGRPVFTGPAPWDVRANLERTLATLGVEHRYVEIDLGMAAMALDVGTVRAIIGYTAGEAALPPWLHETEYATDLAHLPPSEQEIELLTEAGLTPSVVDVDVFDTDVHADELILVPFFYGLHLCPETVPAEDKYRILVTIEEHVDELAQLDANFQQLKEIGMAEIQRRGVAASVDFVPVHPGLAMYLQERGLWDEEWDDRIW